MSILLEALRKSEKNKKKHSVPTIHSDDQSGPVSGSSRIEPLLLIMIVVAFLVVGWFTWRQYRVPDDAHQQVVTPATDVLPAVAGQVTTQPDGKKAAQPKHPGTVADEPGRSPGTAGDNSEQQARTPVESYQGPAANTASSGPGDVETAVVNNTQERNADSGGNKSDSPTSISRESTPAATEQSAPHIPEPIGYWDLPDSIRTAIPEIKFSVLVYTENPEDRFVLINGQRLREGDSIQSGPVVEEIRRDGVVLSYRIYQFLVKR